MYIRRHLEKPILEASRQYPVVMVCGQRQVGKSTMLYHIKEPERRYVSLDDMRARKLAIEDPMLFFETYGMPIFIDEFQRVPELLVEIKRIVDERSLKGDKVNGLVWLTGSQKFSMMKNVSESLAGRTAVFELSSLSTAEWEGREPTLFSPEIDDLKQRCHGLTPVSVQQIYDQIFMGGMPGIRTSDISPERYYADYISTYLEKDIHDLSQVGKLHEFYDFLVYMAARTGQELKYAEISRNIGISSPTAKAWVSILERSGMIFLLRPYHVNVTKRLVKTPKMYFMDTGLAAYLCRWPDAEVLAKGAMDGAFLETYVITEIVKSYYHAGRRPELYYYRDTDKREVDLLILRGNDLFPIEIKKSKNPRSPEKKFNVLKKLGLNVKPGIVICMTDEWMPMSRNVWLCPVAAL